MNELAHVACIFNHLCENQVLFKVTASHVYTVNVVTSRKRCQIASLLLQTTNRKWHMTYPIEAISMTLSHFQGHSFYKPVKYDFYARDAMLVGYLLSSRVRPPSVRPFVISRCTAKMAKCRTSETPPQDSQRLQFTTQKIFTNFRWNDPQRGRQIACVDRSRSLRLRLTAESSCPSDGGQRPRQCAGGERRDVINNFGDSHFLMISVTVQLTSIRLVVWTSVDDTHVYLCMWHGASHAGCAVVELTRTMRVQCYAGSGIKRGNCRMCSSD